MLNFNAKKAPSPMKNSSFDSIKLPTDKYSCPKIYKEEM